MTARRLLGAAGWCRTRGGVAAITRARSGAPTLLGLTRGNPIGDEGRDWQPTGSTRDRRAVCR